MELLQIYNSLLDKPDIPKFYRDLKAYYQKHGLIQEAEAIGFLIENKFGKNNDKDIIGANVDEKQLENN